jgi:hypothetical protein
VADRLHALEPPWIHVAEATAPAVTQWGRQLERQGGTVVRILRGKVMRDWVGLYAEMASAFRMPPRPDDGLSAINAQLRDLRWLPAKRYLIAIVDAGELLRAVAPEDLSVFLFMLHDVGRGWGRPANPQGEARPFHVVLQEQGTRVAALETHVLKAGVMVDRIDLVT